MSLPVYKQYEVVLLTRHPLRPKLGQKAVAKILKCSPATVKYWLKKWKRTKDLSDSIRTDRPRSTTQKQDQQIISLAEQEMFATSRDIAKKMKKKRVLISDRTVRRRLNEAGAKFS